MWSIIWQLQMLLTRFLRWQTTLDCEMASLPDTLIAEFVSLDWSMVSESTALGLPDLAWSLSVLQPVINCTFTFFITNVFGYFSGIMAHFWTRKVCFHIRLHWMFIYVTFKSYMEWSNTHHASTPITTILSTTVSTYHGLNYFGHMVYAPQTSTYQNIAKLLTHPCI